MIYRRNPDWRFIIFISRAEDASPEQFMPVHETVRCSGSELGGDCKGKGSIVKPLELHECLPNKWDFYTWSNKFKVYSEIHVRLGAVTCCQS